MATLKKILGSTIQVLDDDPVNYAGSWSSGGAMNTARRDFSNKWYNLRSNTSLNRFYRNEWNNAFDAIDDLAKADQLENQFNNFIIIGEI